MTLIEQIKTKYKKENNVYFAEEPAGEFGDLYIKLRNAEGRIYTDEELKHLPEISPRHAYYKEWIIRKHSAEMLSEHITKKPGSKSILEAGCGNGWLSAMLSKINLSEVIGLDINSAELEQAARVFSGRNNLVFVYGGVYKLDMKFDYIVLASVTSYFEDVGILIENLLTKLNSGGELHIIDSPFYKNKDEGRRRSAEYYNKLGFPEMIKHYYHHSLSDLGRFSFRILYNPDSFTGKLKRKFDRSLSPFYWICIPNLQG